MKESVTALSVALKGSEMNICTLRVLGAKVKSEENTVQWCHLLSRDRWRAVAEDGGC